MSLRWNLSLNCLGSQPPKFDFSTGRCRSFETGLKAALAGRIQQLRALQSQTGTTTLVFSMREPGKRLKEWKWRLTEKSIEELRTLAYPKLHLKRSQSTSSATQESSTGSSSQSTPTTQPA